MLASYRGPPPRPPFGDHADLSPRVRSIWQSLPPPQQKRLIQAWRRLLQQNTRSAPAGKEGADESH
jgi:hypothetical protein